MADNTIALEVHGSDFALDDLSVVIEHFHGLLNDLATEVAGSSNVTWRLSRFGTGSILAEVRGEAEDPAVVGRVVSAYDRVGAALANGDPVPFSDAISAHADRLTGLINGRVTSVRFRTQNRVHDIQRPTLKALVEVDPLRDSYGAVEGMVDTLAWRRGTRFVVYPDDGSGAIPCYVSPDQEDRTSQLWRKRVRVEGLLRRDSDTGAPVSIRDITSIEILVPPDAETKDLWGILPGVVDPEPEETIRAGWDDI